VSAHAVELSGRPRREVYAARWSLRKKPEATMAKTEGASPPGRGGKARLAGPGRGLPPRAFGRSRAAAFLMAKGYRILAKRFRTPYGEIDLVAKKRICSSSSRSRPAPASMRPPMR